MGGKSITRFNRTVTLWKSKNKQKRGKNMKKGKILSIVAVTFLFIFSACSVETKDTTPPANQSGVSLTPSASNLIISWVTPNIINLRLKRRF